MRSSDESATDASRLPARSAPLSRGALGAGSIPVLAHHV